MRLKPKSRLISGLVCLLGCTVNAPAISQDGAPGPLPRTETGRPDFQGVWVTAVLTGLELDEDIASVRVAPEDVEAVTQVLAIRDEGVNDPDFLFENVTALSVVNGEHRAAFIIQPESGLMPFTPWAEARAELSDEYFYNGYDDPEQRSTSERCISGTIAAPIRLLPLTIPNQIVQTDQHLVIRNEDVDSARIIEIGGDALPASMTSIGGHSTAEWDGDTLVIRTANLRDDYPYREAGARSIQVTGASVVIERLTMISPDEIHYAFTVEDPAIYAESWLGEFVMARSDVQVWEYACHEANYSLPNILKGGRAQQARQAAAAQ